MNPQKDGKEAFEVATDLGLDGSVKARFASSERAAQIFFCRIGGSQAEGGVDGFMSR